MKHRENGRAGSIAEDNKNRSNCNWRVWTQHQFPIDMTYPNRLQESQTQTIWNDYVLISSYTHLHCTEDCGGAIPTTDFPNNPAQNADKCLTRNSMAMTPFQVTHGHHRCFESSANCKWNLVTKVFVLYCPMVVKSGLTGSCTCTGYQMGRQNNLIT